MRLSAIFVSTLLVLALLALSVADDAPAEHAEEKAAAEGEKAEAEDKPGEAVDSAGDGDPGNKVNELANDDSTNDRKVVMEFLRTSETTDVRELLSKYEPSKTGIEALAALENDLTEAIASAPDLVNRVRNLERLLKVKDAQLEDARNVAKYYSDALEDAGDKAENLENIIRMGKADHHELFNRLKDELADEEDLRQRLTVEEQQLSALERSLKKSQSDAEDPAFSRWMERRMEDLGSLVDDASSGRELGKLVGHVVDDAKASVQNFEAKVQKRVASFLIASLISAAVVVAPVVLLAWAVSRFTKSISYRQHILLGHIFNGGFLFVCMVIFLMTGLDPLVTTRDVSPHYSLLLYVFFCIQWPSMFFLMLYSIVCAADMNERRSFASQALLFLAVCLHASRDSYFRITQGIASAPLLQSNFKNYALYFISTGAMILLTISAAESRNEGLVTDVRNMIQDGMDNFEGVVQRALGDQPLKLKSNIGRSRSRSLLFSQDLTENDIDKLE